MRITKKIFFILITALFLSGNLAAQIYVAPDGNDSNSGKIGSPFATLTKAVSLAAADTLIYMRGGVYQFNATIKLSKSGSEGHTIKVWNYPGEHPVIDFKTQILSTSSRGIYISGKYWHVKGLEIRRAGDNGVYVTGSNNIVEACRMHNNFDSGLQISGGGSYNKIINCDSYANYDSLTHGENADGFSAKLDIGPGNEFHGCRSWNNVDDGWDLYEGQNQVIIDSCWTFQNGYNLWGDTNFQGDGNGFKLGGNYVVGLHIVTNCVSFDNNQKGFDQNNNMGGVTIYNCTSWRNKSYNYSFPKVITTGTNVLKNNIGFGGSNSLVSGVEQVKNSWQGFSVTESDFISLDTLLAKAPRNADSSLPVVDFLRLVSTSSMVDAGVDVGLKFNGAAPDLGAFETGTSPSLPVELNSFSTSVEKDKVILKWRTATETNNSGWNVQRTKDNSEWQTITFMPGSGTTTLMKEYSYTDKNLKSGTYQYRLKQIDLDGTVTYSDIQTVTVDLIPTEYSLTNYPNPFNPTTTIRFTIPQNEFVNLSVFNPLGELVETLVEEVMSPGVYNVQFNAGSVKGGLPSGIYFAKIQTKTGFAIKKLVLLK